MPPWLVALRALFAVSSGVRDCFKSEQQRQREREQAAINGILGFFLFIAICFGVITYLSHSQTSEPQAGIVRQFPESSTSSPPLAAAYTPAESCVTEMDGYYHCSPNRTSPAGATITLRTCTRSEVRTPFQDCWSDQPVPAPPSEDPRTAGLPVTPWIVVRAEGVDLLYCKSGYKCSVGQMQNTYVAGPFHYLVELNVIGEPGKTFRVEQYAGKQVVLTGNFRGDFGQYNGADHYNPDEKAAIQAFCQQGLALFKSVHFSDGDNRLFPACDQSFANKSPVDSGVSGSVPAPGQSAPVNTSTSVVATPTPSTREPLNASRTLGRGAPAAFSNPQSRSEDTVLPPVAGIIETRATPLVPQLTSIQISAGTSLEILTADGVDSAVNHTGDIVSGSLATPIAIKNQLIVPKGTAVYVRLLRVRQLQNSSEVRLVLDHLVYHGQSYTLASSSFDAYAPSSSRQGVEGKVTIEGKRIRIPPDTAIQFQLVQPIRITDAPAKGVHITSVPAGADVFINGAKQYGQTPVTLPLAPGQYNLVLRLPGYAVYAGNIQVNDGAQTQLNVTLNEKATTHPK